MAQVMDKNKYHVYLMIFGRGGRYDLFPVYINIDTNEDAEILFNYVYAKRKPNEAVMITPPCKVVEDVARAKQLIARHTPAYNTLYPNA